MSKRRYLALILVLVPLLILTACTSQGTTTTTSSTSHTQTQTQTQTSTQTQTTTSTTQTQTQTQTTTTTTTTTTTQTQTPVFTLTSTSFANGAAIPSKHGFTTGNKSPQLSWSGGPEGTVSFAFIMDDTDVGNTQGTDFFCHWIVFNIPAAVFELAENQPFTATLSNGARQGQNSYGTMGYGGPDPPTGEVHHYRFRLFALDTMLDLAAGATRQAVMNAITGYILGQVDYTGTYPS